MAAKSTTKGATGRVPDYALGYTNAEHERLIRQAERLAPVTERLFRAAGIAPGQRVLDLGSGVGDVAMLAARLVGHSGEVVGIERDMASISRAEDRVAKAGLRNVSFICSDANEIGGDESFDAAIGRFILMFLPDPAAALRSVSRLVRPGGVLVFVEPSWIPLLALGARLPLWARVLSSIHETFVRSGIHPEAGLDLYRTFQEAGLPAPAMHMEVLLGNDMDLIALVSDLLRSIQPVARRHGVCFDELGSLDTVAGRIHAEAKAANTVISSIPLVGAWSSKPDSATPR